MAGEIEGSPCRRQGCRGRYRFARYCGAFVCDECEDHRGLARCYCGWSASGGNGRAELEACGETIEPEEDWGGSWDGDQW